MAKTKTFEEIVKERILGFSREQLTQFAWLCAVRALPFLGRSATAQEHKPFWYWEENHQIHLYSVLWAIDASRPVVIAAIDFFNAHATASDASDDASDAADASSASRAASAAAYASVYASAYASAYAYTAYVTHGAYDICDAYTASHLVNTASFTSIAANVAKEMNYNINLKPILLNDIACIENPAAGSFHHDTSIYNGLFEQFLTDLRAVGCEYWAELYEKLFHSGFQLDLDELDRRMNVPEEIRQQGAAAVGAYLLALREQGEERLDEARIILLGEGGAGKTSLARRLVDPAAPMPEAKDRTHGVDLSDWNIGGEDGGQPIAAHIWDFAGQTAMHAIHNCFLSERCLYIYVYDSRFEGTNRPSYWLDQIKSFGGDSPVLVLLNIKYGILPSVEQNSLKAKYPSILGFFPVDLKNDGPGLEAFRQAVIEQLRKNPAWEKQKMPRNWYGVKERLRALFEESRAELVTLDDFGRIAAENGISTGDDRASLLENLHWLGISLWYKESERFKTLVLNPGWIADGIYRLVEHGQTKGLHILSRTDALRALEPVKNRYPDDKIDFLFELLRIHELAFAHGQGELFVPLLLPADRPQSLPEIPAGAGLEVRYHSESELPANVVSRLIVRFHERIAAVAPTVWLHGALFQKGGATAIVIENQRSVEIQVIGAGADGFLAELRTAMDDIFSSYKIRMPSFQYRIDLPGGFGAQNGQEAPYIGEQRILGTIAQGQPTLGLPEYGLKIPIAAINERFGITLNINNYYYGDYQQWSITGNQNVIRKTTAFNFKDCSVALQGDLHTLADRLGKDEDAKELEDIAKGLEEAKNLDDDNAKDLLKRKGVLARLKEFIEEVQDEDSALYKKLKGVKKGIKTAQKIGRGYNSIAQWLALPQIPTPFLGKDGV
ncbi:MAG: hypothetical protein LBU47_06480 [Christensenellaceae bacterium]|nr:hypothetical protein [Christensenellaceae bacterium]